MKKSIVFLAIVFVLSSFSTVSTKAYFNPYLNSNTNELLNSRAVKLVIPRYSAAAREAKAEGKVIIQITVNERGKVVEAKMIEGNPIFQEVSQKAALASTFKPKISNGKKVKFSGVVQYTFLIRD